MTTEFIENVTAWMTEMNSKMTEMNSKLSAVQTDVATLQTNVATLQTNVATLQTDVATLQINVATLVDAVMTPRDVKAISEQGREHGWFVHYNRLSSRLTAGSGFFIELGTLGVIFLTAAHVVCPSMNASLCSAMTGNDLAFEISRQMDDIRLVCVMNTALAHTWIELDMWPARCADVQEKFRPVPLPVHASEVVPGQVIASFGVALDADAERLQMQMPANASYALQIRTGVVLVSSGVTFEAMSWSACKLGSSGTGAIVKGSVYSTLPLPVGMSGGPVLTKNRAVFALNHGVCASSAAAVPIDLLVRACRNAATAQQLGNLVYEKLHIYRENGTPTGKVVGLRYNASETAKLSCSMTRASDGGQLQIPAVP